MKEQQTRRGAARASAGGRCRQHHIGLGLLLAAGGGRRAATHGQLRGCVCYQEAAAERQAPKGPSLWRKGGGPWRLGTPEALLKRGGGPLSVRLLLSRGPAQGLEASEVVVVPPLQTQQNQQQQQKPVLSLLLPAAWELQGATKGSSSRCLGSIEGEQQQRQQQLQQNIQQRHLEAPL